MTSRRRGGPRPDLLNGWLRTSVRSGEQRYRPGQVAILTAAPGSTRTGVRRWKTDQHGAVVSSWMQWDTAMPPDPRPL